MTGELDLYLSELKRILAKLREAIEGLDEAQLNWRPSTPEANSVYVIAAHILGNIEAWVLGIAGGQPIERDRPAEFRAEGPEAAPLVARAHQLESQIDQALASLAPATLEQQREPSQSLWGEGAPRPVTVRAALMHAIEHAATHLGHIDVVRDLALAGEQVQTAR